MDTLSWQYPDSVSSRLQAVRVSRGLSREKVAAKVGFSSKQLERWEKGTTPTKRMHLLALAEVYGVTVEELEETEVAA